ncbi:MAG TPA: expansin EXLX1 family cellulose-binding protein [Streptosporangiaceae bacterium]
MHESPRKRVRPLWLWVTMGVVAVTAIGVSTLHFVTASCASVQTLALPAVSGGGGPLLSGVTSGQAYYYTPGGGEGSCSFGALARDGLYVSLGTAQYAGGAACGSYLDVTGPAGQVQAEVVDSCPGCGNGGIDMSEAAFARVASASAGTARVSYTLVRDPRVPGPLELRVANSASRDWLAVQVLNNGNPLSSVAVQPVTGGAWRAMKLSPDDYWAVAAGAGPGPFRIRVSDMFGHSAVATGIRLAPGTVQRSGVVLYTAAGGGPGAPASAVSSPASPASTSSTPATSRATPTAGTAAHAAGGSGASC